MNHVENSIPIFHLDRRAAFQFGVKMSDGRKTRRTGPKDEKAKLDRDWNKISQVYRQYLQLAFNEILLS